MKSIKFLSTSLSILVFFGLAPLASAQNAVVPHIFTSGTPAYADEVNANFMELEEAVNTKSEMMASLGYSVTPTVRGVTISNVLINGGAMTAPVAAGSTINVSLNYKIVDPGCPGCIDEIQVGFSHLAPNGCVYTGVPGTVGVSGSATFSITAPAEAGTYYLGVDRAQDYGCPTHWWNGAPNASNRWFGVITVR